MLIRPGTRFAASLQPVGSRPDAWLGGLLACLTFLNGFPLPVLGAPLAGNPAVVLLLWLLSRLITVLPDLPGTAEFSREPRHEDVNDARPCPCCHP